MAPLMPKAARTTGSSSSKARKAPKAGAGTRSSARKGGASGGGTSTVKKTKSPGGAKKRKAVTFPNYHAAVKFLHDRMDIERTRVSRIDPSVFKLDRMRGILEAMGNPQDSLRTVHIGGTNGKGSICAMVTSCLRECGYTVGTYTSPHLVELRERITINGSMISHSAFTELMGQVATAVEALPEKLGQPTFFEVMTALALAHYAEQAVDLAVIEVGLGGRLDSTNVITPDVAAVGAVSLDHTQILGETVEKIAAEKAGIFKKDRPALTFQQDAKIIAAMREFAERAGAQFQVVGDDIEFSFRFESSPQLGPHTRVGLSSERNVYEHVPTPLPGEHQAMNTGLVLAILDKLAARGFELPEGKVIAGLEKTVLPGRMEIIWRQPRVMIDGAHNPAALGALVRSVGAHVSYDSMVTIFGCAADKDVDEMLRRLATGADKVIFTRSRGNPRACDPAELARRFNEVASKMCQVAPTLEEALSTAVRAAGREDLILVTGSFYLAGEAKKMLTDKAEKADRAAKAEPALEKA